MVLFTRLSSPLLISNDENNNIMYFVNAFFLMGSMYFIALTFNFPTTLRGDKGADCSFPHFTDEKTEFQRG